MKYTQAINLARKLREKQTPAEAFFWKKVRNRRLFQLKFNRQYIVNYAEVLGVNFYYIVDFYCHEHQLIIELDGPIHQLQVEYDLRRQNDLIKMGYSVLRFSNKEVLGNWLEVKNSIEEAVFPHDSPPTSFYF